MSRDRGRDREDFAGPDASPARILRRLAAYCVLDPAVHTTVLVLFYLLYVGLAGDGASERFVLRKHLDHDLASSILSLVAIVLQLLDKIAGPALFGRTAAMWIAGYRLVDRRGKRPSWLRSIVRSFAYAVELLTLGLPTLVMVLVRRDRATLHDLATGTRAVLDPRPEWRRGRLVARVACPVLALCYLQLYAAHVMYRIKVLPVEEKLADEGRYPEIAATSNLSARAPARLGPWVLGDADGLDFDACEIPDRPGTYRLSLDGATFEAHHRSRPSEVFLFTTLSLDDELADIDWWVRTTRIIDAIVGADPLAPSSHARALETAQYRPPDFGLFTPIDNLALVTSKVGWVIVQPNYAREGMAGIVLADDRSTIFVTKTQRETFGSLDASATSAGMEHRLDVMGETDGRALDHLYEHLQLGMTPAPPPPPCEGPVEFAWEPASS